MLVFVNAVHLITCVLLILVILIQSGKGAEISASFSGSSQTVFGSSGGANFFVRFTQVAAAIFFVTSLGLTILGDRAQRSMFEGMPASSTTAPVNPATPANPAAPTAAAPAAPAATNAPATAPTGAQK